MKNTQKTIFSASGSIRGITGRQAFTLVELLVSMAILGLIVVLMGNVFSNSSKACKNGFKHSDQNLNGRVIIDYLARELKQSVADGKLTLTIKPGDVSPYNTTGLSDDITFATFGGNRREVKLVRYYLRKGSKPIGGVPVDSYQLMRVVNTNSVNDAYKNGMGIISDGPAQISRNMTGFAVVLGKKNAGKIEMVRGWNEDDLPLFADIYMGIMGDSDLVEAMLTSGASTSATNFIHSREMVFMKRVYFRNRRGYNEDYGRF